MEARFRQKINDFENKTKYYFLDSDVFIRINYFSFYIFTFKTFDLVDSTKFLEIPWKTTTY